MLRNFTQKYAYNVKSTLYYRSSTFPFSSTFTLPSVSLSSSTFSSPPPTITKFTTQLATTTLLAGYTMYGLSYLPSYELLTHSTYINIAYTTTIGSMIAAVAGQTRLAFPFNNPQRKRITYFLIHASYGIIISPLLTMYPYTFNLTILSSYAITATICKLSTTQFMTTFLSKLPTSQINNILTTGLYIITCTGSTLYTSYLLEFTTHPSYGDLGILLINGGASFILPLLIIRSHIFHTNPSTPFTTIHVANHLNFAIIFASTCIITNCVYTQMWEHFVYT